MSVLIKGGRIVTAADDYVGDIYVEDETVTLIGASLDVPADRTIDATGKYVLPGCVDPHTHLDMPFGGTVTIDDFESGQASAAFGGTTCHVDFAIQGQGLSFAETLETWHAKREGKALIDNGYHMAVTDLKDGGTLEELAALPAQGITSYKLFMAYKGALMVDDETLFRTMEVAARDRRARDGARRERRRDRRARRDARWSRAHRAALARATRPPETEGEATNRAIQLARVAGCALYVVHVSCAESVEPIRRRPREGLERPRRDVHAVLRRRRDVARRGPTSRARSTSTRRRRAPRRTTTCCGTRCAPTCSRRSRPTTARSSGTARRRWAATTSRRSRTARPASRTGCT